MSWGYVAVGAGTLIGGYLAGEGSKDAAATAAGAQSAAADAGIAEQRRQFDAIQKLLAPYVAVGEPALAQQRALIGLSGPAAEKAAIANIEKSPAFLATIKQGENALLQNASATGGLRGGNIQAALAQFRPKLLQQAIEDQYGRLAGMTTLGQQSAAGVGSAGMQTGANVASLLEQQGAAVAGGALARGNVNAGYANLIPQVAGAYAGYQNNFGSSPQPSPQQNTTSGGGEDGGGTLLGLNAPLGFGGFGGF